MTTLGLLIMLVLFGGMIFYSFGFLPLCVNRLLL